MEAGFPAGAVNVVTGYGEERGRGTGASSGRQQDRLHRLDRGRQDHRAQLHGRHEARLARAGRQEPGDRAGRLRSRGRGRGRGRRDFLQSRPGLHRRLRLFVHKSRYDQVLAGLASTAESTKLGDGFDETAQMGPMVSATHRGRGALHRVGQGRGRAARRRTSAARIGLLRAAHRVLEHHRQGHDLARGNLRAGGRGDALRRSRRRGTQGERLALRFERQHLDQQPHAGLSADPQGAGRDRPG
ncbi:MAG: aldehyde dehydrogenase family protein [Steroidobacteraceae bacterium]